MSFIIHHFLSLSPSPPVPFVALVKGSQPFTGEGIKTSHSPVHVLLGWFVFPFLGGVQWQMSISMAFAELPIPNACLLKCCCILLHPCGQLRWKMCLSFQHCWYVHEIQLQIDGWRNGILYCSGNDSSHTERDEGGLYWLEIENRGYFCVQYVSVGNVSRL